MADVTKDDFRDLRDTLSEQMREGFERTHERLDILNGRVGKGEVRAGEHGVRLTNLEREVFRRRPRGDAGAVGESGDGRRLTQRDVNVAIGTLVAAGGIAGFVWKLLPILLKAVAP